MSKKIALVSGVTGQDGSYMAEFLLLKGYEVHGIIRRASTQNTERIQHLIENNQITLHQGDLTDSANIYRLLAAIQPDEIYNLASQSHVMTSFWQPEYTAFTNGVAAFRFLEAIRQFKNPVKFYQASSSEMFGNTSIAPQSEETPFKPDSPYAITKVMAHHATRLYREAYGIFAVGGILFNHESPRRGREFVTRKITSTLARIKAGKAVELRLGNLASRRDWGYAPEYVEAAWRMMQQEKPEDFVIATGETHTVEEFLGAACELAGIDRQKVVKIDQQLMRPVDVHHLCGDSTKARRALGWEPKVRFGELVKIMLEADCAAEGVRLS